jgi:molecular chaperone Hsp33
MNLGPIPAPNADFVQPFQIEGHGVRGRLIRLAGVADEIIQKHAYPEPVARLLAQMMALAATLAAALKYEGVFTLQTKGDGPIRLMVADMTSSGAMRGYAQFDAEAVAALPTEKLTVPRLLGAGYLAFTVDQGEESDRYQGIVELEGASLVDCIHHYFRQSEQLQAGFKLAVEHGSKGWCAAAIMLQRLPAEETDEAIEDADDAWRRAMIMLASCTDEELVSTDLPINDLLYRLFHEDGVRVFTGHALHAQCRCSRERVESVLRRMPADDIDHMERDGKIEVVCEFCNSKYEFAPAEFKGDVA